MLQKSQKFGWQGGPKTGAGIVLKYVSEPVAGPTPQGGLVRFSVVANLIQNDVLEAGNLKSSCRNAFAILGVIWAFFASKADSASDLESDGPQRRALDARPTPKPDVL